MPTGLENSQTIASVLHPESRVCPFRALNELELVEIADEVPRLPRHYQCEAL